MLPIERVFGTIMGNPVDRIPFTLTLSLYGAKLINCPLNEYYSNPVEYANGQTAVIDTLEPDIIFSPFALVKEAEAFGSVTAIAGKNAPTLRSPAINDASAISSLQLPDSSNHPSLNYLLESTRLLAEKYKNQIPVAAVCASPTELPALIMGIEGWLDTLLFHPDKAMEMMELTSAFFVDFANSMLNAGASCIVTLGNFTNPAIITRQMALELTLPVLQQNYAKIKGPIIFHHGGPTMNPFLDMYLQLPNIAGIVISPKDSFEETRRIAGNDLTVFGNLNGPLLWKYTPKVIEKLTMEILENRRADHHFILCSSNADVPYDTPLENLKIINRIIKNNQW